MTYTADQFKLGTTYANQALLSTLGIVCPKASTPSYSQPMELANGLIRNNGWLQCQWEWTEILPVQYTILRVKFPNQSGSIYMTTLDDTQAWTSYLCVYRFQSPLPPIEATRRLPVTVQFVNMVVVTS